MAEESTPLDPAAPGTEHQPNHALIRRLETELEETRAHCSSLLHTLQEREAQFGHSAAGRYWS